MSYGDITEFIAETCKSFKALSQKHNIELKVCINTSKIEMDFDRNKVQRIISNLLSNAIKYNHDNGSVIVAIDKILAGDGEQIHIQISDTGIGIKMRIRIRFSTVSFRNSTFLLLILGVVSVCIL